MPDLVLELKRNPQEPARARAFVAEHLAGCSADTRDDAVLLVSELVSNVVQHGALPARMSLEFRATRLHVIVEDSGSGIPHSHGLPDPLAPTGRGLVIVAAIAAAWGISTAAGQVGKRIWFDLTIVE